MKSLLPFPFATVEVPDRLPLPAREAESPRLPRVEWTIRKTPLLHAGPFRDNGDVLSLNLAQGCAHRCGFCNARAFPSYRGDGVVYVFKDAAERLAMELAARKERPRAVCISPATDPFMPLVEVQAETARVVAVLAERGVEAWLLTRGLIRPAAFDVLVKHRQRVRVTVGMTTADAKISRLLEPLAAPPRLRLRQLARLCEAGIAVSVQVAPLVPRLTDRRANLEPLLDALAKVGVQRISVGYMFLRSGIRANLLAALQAQGLDESLLHDYETGPLLAADGIAAARYLPKSRRQQGYAALMALAAPRGIRVSICGLTNPDFTLAPSRSGR